MATSERVKPYEEKIDVPCPVCGAEVYLRKSRRGRKFYICSNNKNDGESCNYISWDKPKEGEKWTPENQKENKEKKKKTARKKKSKK